MNSPASPAPAAVVHRPSPARYGAWVKRGGFLLLIVAGLTVLRDPVPSMFLTTLVTVVIGGAGFLWYLMGTTLTLSADRLVRRRFGRTTTYQLGPATQGVLGLRRGLAPITALVLRDPSGRRLTLHDAYWEPEALAQVASRISVRALPEDLAHGAFAWARAGGDLLPFTQRRPGWTLALALIGLVVAVAVLTVVATGAGSA